MEGRCERHQFDRSVDRCGRCGGEFCGTCVVYSFGPKKPPFCLPCAVSAGGVRSRAARGPALSRRERKVIERERLAALAAPRDELPPLKQAVEFTYFDAAPAAAT